MIQFDYYVLNWIFNHQVDDGLFFAWEVELVQNKNAVFCFAIFPHSLSKTIRFIR